MVPVASKLTRRDIICAALVAAAALIVYVITLAPTVTTEDSGELIAAAYSLGVPHPPGYPLWCLLGKLFTLLPVSVPAWRVNFMSAVFGSLTAGMLFLICRQIGARRIAAAGAALCLAWSRRLWSQAVVAEVYTLNTFLLAGVILLVLLWAETGRRGWAWGAAAVFGLSLSNHYMLMLLTCPAIVAYAVWSRPRDVLCWKLTAACILLVLAGLSLYAYLPLAARAGPPINWGEPTSWGRFWFHVTRKGYRSVDFAGDASVWTKLRFIGHFLTLLWRQFTPYVLVPLGLLGLWTMRRRRELLMLGGVALLNSVLLIAILRFAYTPANLTRVEEYYLPAYLCIAAVIAVGLSRLQDRLADRGQPIAVAVAIAIAVAPLLTHWRHNDLSDHRLAEQYGRAILEPLPRDAVYFGRGDQGCFPAIYLQVCEGVRPDVLIADVGGYLGPGARRHLLQLDPEANLRDLAGAPLAIVSARAGRRAHVRTTGGLRLDDDCLLRPWGLTYVLYYTLGAEGGVHYTAIPADAPPEPPRRMDPFDQQIMSHWELMRAEGVWLRGQKDEARERYLAAADYVDWDPRALSNIGAACAQRGFLDDAARLFQRALEVDPDFEPAERNLELLQRQRRN